MLKQRVKLIEVGNSVAYQKRDKDNTPMKTPDGQDVVGHLRQLVFESQDFKKDSIPITLFNDEAQSFNIAEGTEGELHFQCEAREKQNDGSKRYYPELRMIDFNPVSR